MAHKLLSMEEQLEILMHGTRFADEEEGWGVNKAGTGSLRTRMREELREKLKLGRPLRVYQGVDPTSA